MLLARTARAAAARTPRAALRRPQGRAATTLAALAPARPARRPCDVTATRHLSDAATPQFRLLDATFDASQMSEPVQRVLNLQNASTADATKARSQAVAAVFRQHDADCGSTRVQVARLTVELEALAAHVKAHKKDKHSTRGYQLKISKRRRLLAYLKRRNPGDYEATLIALGLPTPREGKKRRARV
jgi:small subunit ribosomal protein S15